MRRLACILLGLACGCNVAWAETQFKIITLQHRIGQDLLPAIQPLVGEDGAASANGTISRGEVRILSSGRHRPGGSGVTVEMERQGVSTSAHSGAQITVLDGAQAVITVGQSVPRSSSTG